MGTIVDALPEVSDVPAWCDPIARDGNRFVPGVPKGRTLEDRMVTLIETLDAYGRPEAVEQSLLAGPPLRLPGNGLGFDYRRLIPKSWGDGSDGPQVDPVVELLCIAALPMFHRTSGGGWRGWGADKRFRWWAWTEPRDWWDIDQLIHSGGHRAVVGVRPTGRPNDVTDRYISVRYQAAGPMDPTRGYNSHLET